MPTPSGAGKGRLFLLKVASTTSPTNYLTVAGLKATTLSIANAVVDITSKDDAPWRTLMANVGDRTVALSGTGVFKDSVAENLVRGYALNGLMGTWEITADNGDIFTGNFLCSKMEYTGNYNGAQEYSMSLEASGVVTLTAHP